MSDYMVSETSGPIAIHYKRIVVWMHWITAVLVLMQLYIGFTFHRVLEQGTPERAYVFAWHKTWGVLILLLALARLAVRILNPPPPYPSDYPKWRRFIAVWNHRLFYILLIALPLTGLTATSDRAVDGWVPLQLGLKIPAIPGVTEAVGDAFGEVHELLVWTTIALLVLHVSAALYNQFGSPTTVADRMPPFRARR